MGMLVPLRHYSSFRRLALAQWAAPRESSIYGTYQLDVTAAAARLRALGQEHDVKISFGILVGKAIANALASMPEINARIVGRKIYVKQRVDVFFQVDVSEGGDLTGAVIADADKKSLPEIARELHARAAKIRSGDDEQYEKSQKRGLIGRAPIWLLSILLRFMSFCMFRLGMPSRWFGAKTEDPFGSVMVSNVGALGIEAGFAPLVPWTLVPIVILVGAAKPQPVVVDDKIAIRNMLPVCATIDHRIMDGAHIRTLSRIIREYVENVPG